MGRVNTGGHSTECASDSFIRDFVVSEAPNGAGGLMQSSASAAIEACVCLVWVCCGRANWFELHQPTLGCPFAVATGRAAAVGVQSGSGCLGVLHPPP